MSPQPAETQANTAASFALTSSPRTRYGGARTWVILPHRVSRPHSVNTPVGTAPIGHTTAKCRVPRTGPRIGDRSVYSAAIFFNSRMCLMSDST